MKDFNMRAYIDIVNEANGVDEAAGHTKDHVHTGGDTTDMSQAEIETMNKRLDKHAPGIKGKYTRDDVTYKHETPGAPGWAVGLTDTKTKELHDRLTQPVPRIPVPRNPVPRGYSHGNISSKGKNFRDNPNYIKK